MVIGKADLLDEQQLEAVVARICERVRARNPDVPIVRAVRGGIDPALVTCDDDNVGSVRVIEAAGGVLEDVRGVKRRYWVPTGS